MRFIVTVLTVFGSSMPAWADTCTDHSRAIATADARLLAPNGDVVAFCAPCGDATARPLRVGLLKVVQTDVGDEQSFDVTAEGKTVDLADVYACAVVDGGRECRDIGLAVECADDSDVPAVPPEPALPR